MQRTQLDLFSGIGGFALACRWLGIETIGFCKIEPYAQRVLQKNFPGVRIFEDVRKLQTDEFPRPWLITGGYPCQPFSQAGKRRGEEDDRHLWPAMFEIIRSSRPDWVLAENVAGHISMGIDQVLSDLESEDYTVQPLIIPACAVDAPHRRDRVWIVCNAKRDSKGRTYGSESGRSKRERKDENIIQRDEVGRDFGNASREIFLGNAKTRRNGGLFGRNENRKLQISELGNASREIAFADSNRRGCEKRESERKSLSDFNLESESNGRFWSAEPSVGRVAHGVPSRVHRLRGLGNAIVPQVAYEIITAMI